ncbi:unnamed protein product, partial [Polarella glacialis]
DFSSASSMPVSGLEVDNVSVCGRSFRILRRRQDYFAACAGDLPVTSTGTVLWECSVLLSEYLGFASFLNYDVTDAATDVRSTSGNSADRDGSA